MTSQTDATDSNNKKKNVRSEKTDDFPENMTKTLISKSAINLPKRHKHPATTYNNTTQWSHYSCPISAATWFLCSTVPFLSVTDVLSTHIHRSSNVWRENVGYFWDVLWKLNKKSTCLVPLSIWPHKEDRKNIWETVGKKQKGEPLMTKA